jgi:hypothetical protein
VPGTTRVLRVRVEETKTALGEQPRPHVAVPLAAVREDSAPVLSIGGTMNAVVARLKTWWQSRSSKPKV